MTKKNFQEKKKEKRKKDLYLMKILISFEFEKKLDLYLMKIQISFVFRKIKFVFNENTDQF